MDAKMDNEASGKPRRRRVRKAVRRCFSISSSLALLGLLVCLGGRCGASQKPRTKTMNSKTTEDTTGAPGRSQEGAEKRQNRLALEKSPYLLQHADNPVDWYPWGPEAFAKARQEDKPVFLSIGYSTCHWCHVMEHESFEDREVARLMNQAFVCIKVDREERPDIDNVYMTVCQMLTGSGGWPLTIVMTPDKRPFFAGTYFPKRSRFGRIGLMELIPRLQKIWSERKDEVVKSANQIAASLQRTTRAAAGEALDESVLNLAAEQLTARFDREHGGFGRAPKFPTPHNLLFLLRHWKRTGNERLLDLVEKTLQALRRGGIYDHVGFGFHRYSTDRHWLVPHFEKMLYDQALLAMAYTEAYQATGKDEYQRTAREVLTYVLRDMTSPEGGFYSAEDADSEGEEGKFYLWTADEIRHVLTSEEAELAVKVFNVQEAGNFAEEAARRRTGRNILHLTRPLPEIAAELGLPEADLRKRLEAIRRKLFAVRERRVHPHKDDKILTDWNGLMIAALAKAARAFDKPRYAEAAQRAANFILKTLRNPDGRLLHRFRDGQAALPAHVDDYAFLIWGLLELYESTFDVRRLEAALALNRDALEHFWDEQGGGFYFTATDAEELLVRQKEIYDGAVPSGNSVAMLNLLRLARITGDPALEERAERIARAFAADVRRAPIAYTQLMVALDFAAGPSYEVVVAGDRQAKDTRPMLTALRSSFVPNKVVLFRPSDEESPAITRVAEFTRAQRATGGRATAYVCQGGACKQPTTDVAEMLQALHAPTR